MGLLENIQTEPISKLAVRKPIFVDRSCTVRDAILAMRRGKLGCAIVIDSAEKPVGLFTEAILRHLIATSPAAVEEDIESHMATTFPWAKISDPIETVLEAMELKKIRFVIVVDEQGKVAGLTGQKGLMEYVAEHFSGEVMVQRVGTKPYPTSREGA